MSSPVAAQTHRFQEKREALLSAAARLFNEHGVKGATLADIAASVGLVTNSVTYYYRKKEDLATACYERSIAALDALAVRAAEPRSVPARLQAFLTLYAQLLADIAAGRHVTIVTFNDIRALPSPQVDEVYTAYTDMFRRVRQLLSGPETTHLTRDDLNARGHILLSTVHWMRAWIGRYEVDEYPRVAARVADFLVHGMRTGKSRWRADGPAAEAERGWRLANAAEGSMEAFLRAATVLVNEQGYRGASVEKISARLNVTKGSFYHHNDHKHDLISECFERTFAVVREALALAEASPGSGWSRACAAARALVRYQLADDGPLLRTSAMSALPDEQHRAQVKRTMSQLTERLGGIVVDGMMDGSIRPLDPAIAAQCALAAINAAAELHRWLPRVREVDSAEVYVRPLFEGMLCLGSKRVTAGME